MSKEKRKTFTEEFKREAVRLVETSGLTINKIADDLGVGRSTLTRWISIYREQELLSGPHEDVNKELARLRKENNLLRQGDKSMRFRLIDAMKAELCISRMCTLLDDFGRSRPLSVIQPALPLALPEIGSGCPGKFCISFQNL